MEPNYKFTEDNLEHWVFNDGKGRYSFPIHWSEAEKLAYIKESEETQKKYLEEGPPPDAEIVKNGDTEIIKYNENGYEIVIKRTTNLKRR